MPKETFVIQSNRSCILKCKSEKKFSGFLHAEAEITKVNLSIKLKQFILILTNWREDIHRCSWMSAVCLVDNIGTKDIGLPSS